MFAFNNFIKTTKPHNDEVSEQPRKGKRLSEEDPKSLLKRIALGDVTNKQEKHKVVAAVAVPASSTRLTRSKKKELDQQTQPLMLCNESTTAKAPVALESPESSPEPMCDDEYPINRRSSSPSPSPIPVPAHQEKPVDEWDSIPHADIDVGDENDPQLCCVYVNDIYEYLRENEVRYHPKDYMMYQKDITPHMRAILVDWLIEVAEEYKLSSETLYLAVSYIDRYLSKKTVLRGKLQLVGVAAMLLASKYEEIYAPSVDDFVYISDNTYTKEEVFCMESSLLDTLEFCLTGATTKNFLRRFLKAAGAGADVTVTMFANYLCELSLHDYSFVKYLPSVVAAASVVLSLHTLSKTPSWTSTLEYYTRLHFSDDSLRKCITDLLRLHKDAPKASLQAVQEKYLHQKFCRVSDHKCIIPSTTLPF
jgi:cyclin A